MSQDACTRVFNDRTGARLVLTLHTRWTPYPSRALISLRDSIDGTLLQITLLGPETERFGDDIHGLVTTMASQALFRSVEPSIDVTPFQSGSASGYYFSAQDRKPKPGDWPFMTSGMLLTQGRILTFTILSHRAPPEGTREGMTALANLEFTPARA